MPQFTWTGRDRRQVVRSGVIEAESARHALRQLARASLAAVAVLPLPAVPQAVAGDRPDLSDLRAPVFLDALRQLVHLMRQGVATPRACAVAGASTPHAGLSDALHRLGETLAAGKPLAEALQAYPELFDPLGTGLVASGETIGTPGHGFATLYQYIDFEHTVAPYQREVPWPRLYALMGWHRRLPAKLRRLQDMTRLFGWLALGQRAGLSLDESLARAAARAAKLPLAPQLAHARQALAAGAPLGAAMCEAKLAPLEARPLLDHAQAHGNLEGTLAEMARQYQQHLLNASRR